MSQCAKYESLNDLIYLKLSDLLYVVKKFYFMNFISEILDDLLNRKYNENGLNEAKY